ncbi:GAF domain-containing protein [Microbacterium hatanonis]|nr:GAF domain-containing protein [Microbacterium hatanonis]
MVEEKKKSPGDAFWVIFGTAIPILGAAGFAQFLAVGRAVPPVEMLDDAPPPPFWATEAFGWFAAAAVCAVLAVLFAVIAKVRESRKKGALERTNEELRTELEAANSEVDGAADARQEAVATARREQLIKLRDVFMRFASTTADMALQPLEERHGYLKMVANVAAEALAGMVGGRVHRPRAVVYLLYSDPTRMESIGHGGRGERPRPFEADTPRGDAALDFLDAKTTASYPNLDKVKPAGYEGTGSGYKTFISVPIWTANGVYGMVSLDAPKANSFDDGDVALTELTAELMSIPFEVGQDQDTPEPVDAE